MFEAQRVLAKRESIKARRDTPLFLGASHSRSGSAHSFKSKRAKGVRKSAEHPEMEIRIPEGSPG